MVRIQELRIIAHLTQFQLAKRSGVGRTRLSLAECGHVELRSEEYEALESALIGAIRGRMLKLQEVLKANQEKLF
jgi:transcriptional regulator with XRE-family HTH domain